MQIIIDKIKEKTELDKDYWDFKDKKDIDSFALSQIMKYPAKMVSDMQRELIDIIASTTEVNAMLDPFCGSGTTLIESLKYDIQPYGIDINPLAYLLVMVKSTKYNIKTLTRVVADIQKKLDDDFDFEVHKFEGIDKWFREDIKIGLSRIRSLILAIESIRIRRFLWVVLSDTVRDSCNSRLSTYKLYMRKPAQIKNLPGNVEKQFIQKAYAAIDEFQRFYSDNKSQKKVKVLYGNVLNILKDKRRFKNECFDLICTSPPYGDNSTTITYGQFSILQLRWIDIMDIDQNIDRSIADTQCAIDKISMGGTLYSLNQIETSGLFEKTHSAVSFHELLIKEKRVDKARKVSSFLVDYDQYFEQSVRVLRSGGYQVITLGNRTVNDRVLPFDQITLELAEYYGMEYVWSFKRNIRNKRRPKTVNRDNTQTINQEIIIILKKK